MKLELIERVSGFGLRCSFRSPATGETAIGFDAFANRQPVSRARRAAAVKILWRYGWRAQPPRHIGEKQRQDDPVCKKRKAA